MDSSPPRRKNKNLIGLDSSPPRRMKKSIDGDSSPPRRRNKNSFDMDSSPPRRKNVHRDSFNSNNKDLSPQRKNNTDLDSSSPKKIRRRHDDSLAVSKKEYLSRYISNEPSDKPKSKPSRWNQDDLHTNEENTEANTSPVAKNSNKSTEISKADYLSKYLSNGSSSKHKKKTWKNTEDMIVTHKSNPSNVEQVFVNPVAIFRDKQGHKRDLEKEKLEKERKETEEKVQQEKYYEWGKGLKQTVDINTRIQNDIYEMSKPLARYADDKDLDEMLKAKEIEGDPMLEYIKSKQKKSHNASTPKYAHDFPPNRFNISPGYRWDGVDRSNGFEKKYFSTVNAKKAMEEEALKWSTEDM